jgi:signal transduction histidine kinase
MRTRLLLLSGLLLALPWLVARYQRDADAFVLEGRRSALQLAAQGVATVLGERAELFDQSAGLPLLLDAETDFAPRVLEAPIQLDGNGRDWSQLSERRHHYGPAHTLLGAEHAQGRDAEPLAFDLSLGLRRDYLYALVEVSDDMLTYRDESYRSLDRSDHLRLTLRDASGALRRLLVTAAHSGPTSSYEVGRTWRYAVGRGRPERAVRGHWRKTAAGYAVELRLPLSMLAAPPEIGVAVADVDLEAGEVTQVVGTYPDERSPRLQRVRLDSAEIDRILRGLELPGARISVIDGRERVRAELGPDLPAEGPGIARASWPITAAGSQVGRVLIEQAERDILAAQHDALERGLAGLGAACVGIAAALWIFAWRVTHRIHRLRDDANAAIAPDGRVCQARGLSESAARDELGDLSRSVSDLLGRLARYTSFLEAIPRTLRHELSNPLNALSTSLQNLVLEHPEIAHSKYVASAERGVERASGILQGITDAASLDDALHDEEWEELDLARLVTRHVELFAAASPTHAFSLRGASAPIFVRGSGFRIEQLLDKLLDNATGFAPPGSVIRIELAATHDSARLVVANTGPRLGAEGCERIFDSMFSSRGSGAHLGLGLYVVRRIAEHMGGRVAARDRSDGAAFEVVLPLSS